MNPFISHSLPIHEVLTVCRSRIVRMVFEYLTDRGKPEMDTSSCSVELSYLRRVTTLLEQVPGHFFLLLNSF